MSLTLEKLTARRSDLLETLEHSESSHGDLKERLKDVKKEIANTQGAIIELDHLLDLAG